MPTFKPEITLAITALDFEKAAAWYQDVLGCQPIYTMPEMGWGEFTTAVPGVNIGIQTSQDGTVGTNGGATITFGVEDLDAVRAELEGKGVKFDGPTDEMEGMVRLASFRDLDGNPLMLAQTLMAPA